ncbi:MAG: TnsA endonuclease N-terminal domain-containing protein [Cyclobacteriaceae bacterium]|jgi:hypothetical protein|nr:TnsA endonuclease N-terminal domain-containing protein [Cytophagales bacterium]MCZ8327787.1 TnsA endonuclease N-terminal domain-containing protein [Cyclobacteriaceae bacterium]
MGRFISDATRIKEGRGIGSLDKYTPWIKVFDLSSSGISWRIEGKKTGRIHHLLSTLEKKVFLFYDNNPAVIDIREQYPLDLNRTIEISINLNLSHIKYEDKHIHMTTDFLIDFEDKQVAISVKPKSKLTKCAIKKFQIEYNYWKSLNVRFYLYTEIEIAKLDL